MAHKQFAFVVVACLTAISLPALAQGVGGAGSGGASSAAGGAASSASGNAAASTGGTAQQTSTGGTAQPAPTNDPSGTVGMAGSDRSAAINGTRTIPETGAAANGVVSEIDQIRDQFGAP